MLAQHQNPDTFANKMAVSQIAPNRLSAYGSMTSSHLEERFEVIKEIGDGSFGSVALARVRTAGSATLGVKRNTMVAIKTMKKTFESFTPCLELREVIFLRSLPNHAHLVPAIDIFLDPMTRKLHIAMEYMDGNLYQLMKSRDHRCLDTASVKSILYQILSGMDHIHTNNFFHRDIKPENILISTSAPHESGSGISFRRYSALVTPPSTPPTYSVKIADFGLAREIDSKSPYTTYVSTRWYRAPEVLLRAGEYSAPVDMWAFGAMAVEVATLKPLFPGGNEVDQVWRVCEIMGSPGNWYNKAEVRIGGGDWKDGKRLAQKLGFSFPKMAPHAMDTILQPPQWPQSFANFVTWCLMWDPRNRPTSFQAMQHDFFTDAVDPLLRPKSRLLGRKHSSYDQRNANRDSADGAQLTSRASWFRKSLIGRDSTPVLSPHQAIVPPQVNGHPNVSTQLPPIASITGNKPRPAANKRATWQGPTPAVGAPMPILPSIRPISPLSNTVTAEARSTQQQEEKPTVATAAIAGAASVTEPLAEAVAQPEKAKKIGRQLSLASHGNHYADLPSGDSRAGSGIMSPTNGQKEGFFSHLRKRARRLSGRNQLPVSPRYEEAEAAAGCGGPFASNRSSMALDPSIATEQLKSEYSDLDKALQNVRYSLDASSQANAPALQTQKPVMPASVAMPIGVKRSPSVGNIPVRRASVDEINTATPAGPISSRTRRALHLSAHPAARYETPDEEEELLDEALRGVKPAVANQAIYTPGVAGKDVNRHSLNHQMSAHELGNPYPTPSPSAKRNGLLFNNALMAEPATPLNVARTQRKDPTSSTWPTPPYEEQEWVNSTIPNTFVSGTGFR